MPAHLTRDVGIQNNDLIRRLNEKRCKKPHGGAAAPHTHFSCFLTVNYRRLADLYRQPAAIFDFQFDRFAIGNIGDGAGNHKSIFTGQPVDTADVQHF